MKSTPLQEEESPPNVSQKHIAIKVGVSESTVQRVFADHPMVSDSVRSRVLGVAEQLGYVPNLNARRLRLGRYETIGVVLGAASNIRALHHSQMVGIASELADSKYDLRLVHFPAETLNNPKSASTIRHRFACDGLLINYTEDLDESFMSAFTATRIPVVWMNFDKPTDCVYVDYAATAKDLVRYLYDLGHRSIAAVNMASHGHYSAPALVQGYREAMAGLGLEENIIDRVMGRAERPAFFRRWLANERRPTAVITYSASVANPLIRAVLESGLRVGRDLSVTSVSDGDEFNIGGWELTHMLHPHFEEGRLAARMLMQKLSGDGEQPAPSIGLRCRLVEGETTCPV